MLEVEVLGNKMYFRDELRLVGPLNYENFHHSLVHIADELRVLSVEVLIVYLEYRKSEVAKITSQEINVQ